MKNIIEGETVETGAFELKPEKLTLFPERLKMMLESAGDYVLDWGEFKDLGDKEGRPGFMEIRPSGGGGVSGFINMQMTYDDFMRLGKAFGWEHRSDHNGEHFYPPRKSE